MSQPTTHPHMLKSTYHSHTDHIAHTGTHHTPTAHTPHTTQDGLPQFMTHHTGDHPATTDIDIAATTAATHLILMPGTEPTPDQLDILMSQFIPHQ